MIIANEALLASLATYHLVSNAYSWSNFLNIQSLRSEEWRHWFLSQSFSKFGQSPFQVAPLSEHLEQANLVSVSLVSRITRGSQSKTQAIQANFTRICMGSSDSKPVLISSYQFALTGWSLARSLYSSCSFWITNPIMLQMLFFDVTPLYIFNE